MIKLSLTFDEADSAKVTELVEMVRRVFPVRRVHSPSIGGDGRYHIHIKLH